MSTMSDVTATPDPSTIDYSDPSTYAPWVGSWERTTDELRDDLFAVIDDKMAAHPRGLQVEIGPSEIGNPCERALAYKLGNVPPAGIDLHRWRPQVGTFIHDGLAGWFADANDDPAYSDIPIPRFLVEVPVCVGELYPGREIWGHVDLLDLLTGTVIDYKAPGPTGMKRGKAGPKLTDAQYRTQLHLYGRGVRRTYGLPVTRCAILRLPTAGERSDATFQIEPYNEIVAVAGLMRAARIARLVDAVGGGVAASVLPATEHHCMFCDWHKPRATDLTCACPGVGKDAARAAAGSASSGPASLTPPTAASLLRKGA